jgi:hypothetical protein
MSPRVTVSDLRFAQIGEFPSFIQRLRECLEVWIGAGDALCVRENSRILPPDSSAEAFVNTALRKNNGASLQKELIRPVGSDSLSSEISASADRYGVPLS